MTTACMRASQLRYLAVAGLALPLLVGQGCPTTSTSLTADAGPDKTVQTSLAVVLQASVSGGSGIYSYSWAPTTGLDNPASLQPTFTATSVGSTLYTLTVTDSRGDTASDTLTITVVAQTGGDDDDDDDGTGGTVLKANAGPDKTTSVGSGVTLEGSASGGTGPYMYSWSPTTGLSNPSAAQPVYTPSISGTVTLTLTVVDALANTASDTVTVTINQTATLGSLTWGSNYAGGGYEVLAAFTRDLNEASAENVVNYRINGTDDHPASATLSVDKRTVSLVFEQKLSSIARLDIGAGGTLLDALGGAVPAATNQAVSVNTADNTSPTTVARTWGNGQGRYTVLVQFSEAMDRGSVESISNYTLMGTMPSSASLDATGMVATLTFANTTAGFRSTDLLQISSDVRDINGLGTTSTNPAGMSSNPADLTGPSAPAADRIWRVNRTRYAVDVTFNEVLDKTSAETLANYAVGGDLPTAASLNSTGRVVTLTFGQTAAGLASSDTLAISPDVLDINGRSNVLTEATSIAANPIDTAGPSLSNEQGRIWANNATSYTLLLAFSEVMDRSSATTLTNYTLAGDAGQDTRNPATAALDPTGRTVTLTFPSTVAGLNRTDLITVAADVRDINGRALTSTTAASINSSATDTIPPIALSRMWKADSATYQVDITFSEVMDKLTAVNLANYRMHGNAGADVVPPTSAVLDPTGRIVTLTFGTSLGGFKRVDAVEILAGVKDINGRVTSSITTVGANVSANPADTTPPVFVRATQVSQGVVEAVFSEVLDKTTAEAAAFVFSGGLTVDGTLLLSDGRTVRLAVSGGDPEGGLVTAPGTIWDVNNNAVVQTDKVVSNALEVSAGLDSAGVVGQEIILQPEVTGGAAPYTYSWTPAANLAGANTSQPSFTPTAVGVYIFTLVVTDSEGRTGTDTVTVVVTAV